MVRVDWSSSGRGRLPHSHSEYEYDRIDDGPREFLDRIVAIENLGFCFIVQFGHHFIQNGMHYQSEILQCYVAHCMMMQLRTNQQYPHFPCNSELQSFIGKVLSRCHSPEFAIQTFASFGLSLPPDHLEEWEKALEAHNENEE